MTVADWAALVITVGWAVTAFLVVHVITRRQDARRSPSTSGDSGRRGTSADNDEQA